MDQEPVHCSLGPLLITYIVISKSATETIEAGASNSRDAIRSSDLCASSFACSYPLLTYQSYLVAHSISVGSIAQVECREPTRFEPCRPAISLRPA